MATVNPATTESTKYFPQVVSTLRKFCNTVFSSGEVQTLPSEAAAQAREKTMSSGELAEELLYALNSKDKELADVLLDKVNESNAFIVYVEYYKHADAIGEKAGLWPPKRAGRRTETLVQGVINSESLTKEEKEAYLNKLVDDLCKHAEANKGLYHVTSNDIEQFKSDNKQNIHDVVILENAASLETRIRRLYHVPD